MSIVRSLLINIGFRVDKKDVDNANRAITGFKTRFSIAATAATYAFSKVTTFFANIAKASLDASELADDLGIAYKDLVGLQEAGKRFRIDDTSMLNILNRFQDLIIGKKFGLSTDLEELLRGLNLEFIPNENALQLMLRVTERLQEFGKENRGAIATKFFPGLNTALLRISKNFNKFTISAKEFAASVGEQSEKNLPVLSAYEQSLISLSEQWKKFVVDISGTVVPALISLLSEMTEPLNILFQSIAEVLRLYKAIISLDPSKIWESMKSLSKVLDPVSSALDPVLKRSGIGLLAEFIKPLKDINTLKDAWRHTNDYIENREGYATSVASPIVNTTVNIGSNEILDNTGVPLDRIEESVRDGILKAFTEIQNNNQQVD